MTSKPNTLAEEVIAKSDVRAERLISVFRMILAALLFIGVSFVLSQTETVGLQTRHLELYSLLAGAGCYFLLGALNYYNATEVRLKPWKIWAFNLGEIILVSVQLYIDVADAKTPSLLVFASPVILVAALVICVQVLRFQIGLHIASTMLLIGLCGLILFHDPQLDQPLSGEAIDELQLLYTVPPNIMRVVMLLAMSALIGMAIYRSKRLIETMAAETERTENRKRFLPSEIYSEMNDENLASLRLGEEREIAVLFADIRSFTKLSEKIGSRETAKFLNQYRAIVMDAVELNNGVIDKFVGDGALIVFGLHSDIRQASANAIHTARDILCAVEEWNENRARDDRESIELAMGIHAGSAMVAAIGDDRRLDFTAVGNTINLASRLEKFAKENDWILAVSRTTAEMADTQDIVFTLEGQTLLRGTSQPVEVLGLPKPT